MSLDLCVALLVSVPVFWLLPQRLRYGFLALVSIAYLLWVDSSRTQAALSVIALANYGLLIWWLTPFMAGEGRGKKVAAFAVGVAVTSFLLYFKYLPAITQAFFPERVSTIVLPLGISYYTFKLLHYVIEVSRGAIAERTFSRFFCYLYLFPTFTAGPIERYDHFLQNLEERWDLQSTVESLRRIAFGLIKRYVLARYVNGLINGHGITELNLVERLPELSTPWLWGYFVLYYVYVYLDFSAYSDIAIAASRLFGIRVLENFRFPIVACDIRDYWRRWHMSLSGWCQSYIYMPVIGLTRQPLAAIFLTFLVMGLWHAGTPARVGWGMYHAVGVVAFTYWNRYHKPKRWGFMQGRIHTLLAFLLTQMFVVGSMCFILQTPGHGLGDSLRILLALIGIRSGQ